MTQLAPGRECGGCTVCCLVPPVDTPEFQKQAGRRCRFCTSTGCEIHADRPPVCRQWYCGWRQLDELDDSWRPDRSGLMVVRDDEGIPSGYADRPGMKFIVTGSLERAFRPEFVRYLVGGIEAGVPMFLALPGPPGHFAAKIFLNPRLAEVAAARDGQGLLNALAAALKTLLEGEFDPVVLQHRPDALQG